MMAASEVLAGYEQLLQRSSAMLELARGGDWPELVAEESAYVTAVETLKRLEADCRLGETEAQRKAELLERILEQDVETRRRLESRRDELSALIGNTRRSQDANRAYRDGGQAVPFRQGHE
ncbi:MULTISPECIES: flagellar protein FliT [unclassified Modicisalibacter]|uniref:flagellar protein FliT n=1 Tax=unclassified Modicisalibacter TaxID=2679913 RepID=UPI001CCD98DF|nr:MULTISPECIES: flagellar protein FliT [unclassified Modicisalibacter]MBZ9556959.1 flagellar protein FliT [Modicisalibacter sp. R2A 31.J]MBZ9574327.1 flagellar protein FliT [Modicisalibacter sp. MOD 31.J]